MSSSVGSIVNQATEAVQGAMNDQSSLLTQVAMEMSGNAVYKAGSELMVAKEVTAQQVRDYATTSPLTENQKTAILDMVGLDITHMSDVSITPKTVVSGGSPASVGAGGVLQLTIQGKDNSSGEYRQLAIELNSEGGVTAFSSEKSYGTKALADADVPSFSATVSTKGVLESWNINKDDLRPGDLFFIQTKLQQIKDLISTIQTTGKSYSDIMREVTQKFAQG